MISDLIPNIPSEAKTATDATKGASEVEKGVFSSLLKTFEQAVQSKGSNGNQSLTGNQKSVVNQEQGAKSASEDASPEETDSDVLNNEESDVSESEQTAQDVQHPENSETVEENVIGPNFVTEQKAVQQQINADATDNRKTEVEANSEPIVHSEAETQSNENGSLTRHSSVVDTVALAENPTSNQSLDSSDDVQLKPKELTPEISTAQRRVVDQQAVLGEGKNILTGEHVKDNAITGSVSNEVEGKKLSGLIKQVSGEGIPEDSNNVVLDQKPSAKIDGAVSTISANQSTDSTKEISGQEDNSTGSVVSEVQVKESVTNSEPIVNKLVEEVSKSTSTETSSSAQESLSRSESSVEQSVPNAGIETTTSLANEAKNSLKSEEKEIPQNKQVDLSQVERTIMPEQSLIASAQLSEKVSKEPVVNVQQPVRSELVNEALNQQQLRNSEQIQNNKEVASAAFPISFSTTQSSEILQVIQQNKALAKVTKDVKSHRFALSNTEQAETRLKLLVDSVRPEILSTRELPADFITTSTDVEITGFPMLSGALTNEQELMLKELMVETTSGKEVKKSEANAFSFLRLSDLPILNNSARRSLVGNFGKVLQESLKTDQANKTEQWQKHSFKLEEGNSIDLTTRNIDGVLHVKLAASNPELNRLLQSMEQEIKDHLKEELGLDLDLQFDQSSGEKDAESLQKGILNEKMKIAANQARELQQGETGKTNSGLSTSIRTFGYNQMEWTA
ncbi:MAG: hypothetical protein NXI08_12765 [bacterium]|nr:hypothetical protein [bacterium]